MIRKYIVINKEHSTTVKGETLYDLLNYLDGSIISKVKYRDLKKAILNGVIQVNNIKITSDNRLIALSKAEIQERIDNVCKTLDLKDLGNDVSHYYGLNRENTKDNKKFNEFMKIVLWERALTNNEINTVYDAEVLIDRSDRSYTKFNYRIKRNK